MNGILRRLPRLLGTSRFVPRGVFSTSHCPKGFRGRAFSSHSEAGTTTNDLRVSIRWGPSSSARRRISDSFALASATVQTRLDSAFNIGVPPRVLAVHCGPHSEGDKTRTGLRTLGARQAEHDVRSASDAPAQGNWSKAGRSTSTLERVFTLPLECVRGHRDVTTLRPRIVATLIGSPALARPLHGRRRATRT